MNRCIWIAVHLRQLHRMKEVFARWSRHRIVNIPKLYTIYCCICFFSSFVCIDVVVKPKYLANFRSQILETILHWQWVTKSISVTFIFHVNFNIVSTPLKQIFIQNRENNLNLIQFHSYWTLHTMWLYSIAQLNGQNNSILCATANCIFIINSIPFNSSIQYQ